MSGKHSRRNIWSFKKNMKLNMIPNMFLIKNQLEKNHIVTSEFKNFNSVSSFYKCFIIGDVTNQNLIKTERKK